jgi:hypothetical protein
MERNVRHSSFVQAQTNNKTSGISPLPSNVLVITISLDQVFNRLLKVNEKNGNNNKMSNEEAN